MTSVSPLCSAAMQRRHSVAQAVEALARLSRSELTKVIAEVLAGDADVDLENVLERQRELLADANRLGPTEQDRFVAALVAHLRAWRPESVCPLQEV